MPLTNAQYDELLRSYDLKQQTAREALERRREEIYRTVPAVRDLDQAIAEAGIQAARQRILRGDYDTSQLRTRMEELTRKRTALLTDWMLTA